MYLNVTYIHSLHTFGMLMDFHNRCWKCPRSAAGTIPHECACAVRHASLCDNLYCLRSCRLEVIQALYLQLTPQKNKIKKVKLSLYKC